MPRLLLGRQAAALTIINRTSDKAAFFVKSSDGL